MGTIGNNMEIKLAHYKSLLRENVKGSHIDLSSDSVVKRQKKELDMGIMVEFNPKNRMQHDPRGNADGGWQDQANRMRELVYA